jgi:hypothetical protein
VKTCAWSHLEDALAAAERMRMAFQAAAVTVASHRLDGTVSIGATCGSVGTDIATLLASADAALYRAKANGRNRVEGMLAEVPATRPPPWQGANATVEEQNELPWHVPAMPRDTAAAIR